MKAKLFAGVSIMVVCAIAGVRIVTYRADREAAAQAEMRLATAREAGSAGITNRPQVVPPPAVPNVREYGILASAATPPTNSLGADKKLTPEETVQDQPLTYNGYEIQDPIARVALSFVGADAEADDYWFGAVNDPSLSSEERKDLIEDLNEDGLSDPRHPTPDDLVLIAERLALVRQLKSSGTLEDNGAPVIEVERDLVALLSGQESQ